MEKAGEDQIAAAIARVQPVARLSPQGIVTEVNALYLRLLCRARSEVVGQPHRAFVDAAALPAYERLWAQLREGKSQQSEFKRVAKGA